MNGLEKRERAPWMSASSPPPTATCQREVQTGRFRRSYYRLNVFPIKVAPLRERKEDIPLLAAHFLEKAARKLNLPPARLTAAHIAQFQNHDWPGNIRELQNAIERALILAQNGTLWFDFSRRSENRRLRQAPSPGGRRCQDPAQPFQPDLGLRQQGERDDLEAALNKARWKIHGAGGAAELLGLRPSALISRIKKLGLKKPDPLPP